jgi:hypothetical protein
MKLLQTPTIEELALDLDSTGGELTTGDEGHEGNPSELL